jgi:hypothetical protein
VSVVIRQSRVDAIQKLAVAGERAGLTLQQMIQLLDSGMSVVGLLESYRVAAGSVPTVFALVVG